MERDVIAASLVLKTSAGRPQLNYQVQVLVNGVAARMVQPFLKSRVSCAVTSVIRGCSNRSEVNVFEFFVTAFNTVSYPDQLNLITHIKISTT